MRLELETDDVGERLDRVLCAALGLGRAEVKRLFLAQAVRVRGRQVPKSYVIRAGDWVELPDGASDSRAQPEPGAALTVRYEDVQLVVVDKPRGQPTHPLRAGELGCLANALVARFPEMAGVGFDVRQPGLVHRLDNDTSGLVLAARSQEAFEAMRGLFARHALEKEYLAVTCALPSAERIETALGPSPSSRRKVQCRGEGPAYVTQVNRVEPRGSHYWVWLNVSSAYRHQIRVHLAALGAPLVGDVLYGGAPRADGLGHALHATRIAFTSPFSGQHIQVDSPAPADFPGAS